MKGDTSGQRIKVKIIHYWWTSHYYGLVYISKETDSRDFKHQNTFTNKQTKKKSPINQLQKENI